MQTVKMKIFTTSGLIKNEKRSINLRDANNEIIKVRSYSINKSNLSEGTLKNTLDLFMARHKGAISNYNSNSEGQYEEIFRNDKAVLFVNSENSQHMFNLAKKGNNIYHNTKLPQSKEDIEPNYLMHQQLKISKIAKKYSKWMKNTQLTSRNIHNLDNYNELLEFMYSNSKLFQEISYQNLTYLQQQIDLLGYHFETLPSKVEFNRAIKGHLPIKKIVNHFDWWMKNTIIPLDNGDFQTPSDDHYQEFLNYISCLNKQNLIEIALEYRELEFLVQEINKLSYHIDAIPSEAEFNRIIELIPIQKIARSFDWWMKNTKVPLKNEGYQPHSDDHYQEFLNYFSRLSKQSLEEIDLDYQNVELLVQEINKLGYHINAIPTEAEFNRAVYSNGRR